MISASSSVRARIRAATSWSISARSPAGVAPQGPAASRAAAMAASTCSSDGSATLAWTSARAGSSTSRAGPSPSTSSPPISSFVIAAGAYATSAATRSSRNRAESTAVMTRVGGAGSTSWTIAPPSSRAISHARASDPSWMTLTGPSSQAVA